MSIAAELLQDDLVASGITPRLLDACSMQPDLVSKISDCVENARRPDASCFTACKP